jgi:nitroreductase
MEAIQHLKWRYATKKYSSKTIPSDQIDIILESVRLSPTSLGLQAFKVFVIHENSELRQQMLPIAYNQTQVSDASHLLVFAAYNNVTETDVHNYLNNIANTREIPLESLDGFKKSIQGFTGSKNEAQTAEWASKQCYIALGIAMSTAAQLHIDTTPMEGFNHEGLDTVLGLKERGLTSSVILALGYRDEENDKLSRLAKVRKPHHELFEVL